MKNKKKPKFIQNKLSKTFNLFFESEKSSGILLIICTIASLILANSIFSGDYLGFWRIYIGGLSIEHWVNDALMALFFLLIGLELVRELKNGELSNIKNALLPIFAALGDVVVTKGVLYFIFLSFKLIAKVINFNVYIMRESEFKVKIEWLMIGELRLITN